MTDPVFVELSDPTFVGAARRRASDLADRLGFDDAAVGRLAVVVTELSNNVVVHAGGGELFARGIDAPDGQDAIEVTVVDRGVGIPDVERALEDGFSTASSSGTGLGAVSRMAEAFHIHSSPGGGTVATAIVRREAGAAPTAGERAVSALVRPHPHEEQSGDGWGARRDGDRHSLAMVDGLGHGPQAGEAASRAVSSFLSDDWRGPSATLGRMHDALRRTRGAVGGVLELDHAAGVVRFAGVGNVAACVVDRSRKRSLVSMNGTLGVQQPRIREYEYPCRPGCVAVMHTDGISARWGVERVADVVGRDPALICGVIYLAGYRRRDDAAVVAMSCERLGGADGGGLR